MPRKIVYFTLKRTDIWTRWQRRQSNLDHFDLSLIILLITRITNWFHINRNKLIFKLRGICPYTPFLCGHHIGICLTVDQSNDTCLIGELMADWLCPPWREFEELWLALLLPVSTVACNMYSKRHYSLFLFLFNY